MARCRPSSTFPSLTWANAECISRIAAGADPLLLISFTAFSRVSVADGKWHHIALVNRGPRTCLYVDGRKVPGEAFLFGSSGGRYLGPMRDAVAGREIGATRLFLGATNLPGKSGETPVAFYRGLIDDFRIWRRPLTPADIAALMATAAR